MKTRTMVVVAGGSSTRFGSDKLMTVVEGLPLIAHTVRAIAPLVDECVLVVRDSNLDALAALNLDIRTVPGGASRTASEILGLAAAEQSALIGIHDGARPIVNPDLVNRLFQVAAERGGAVPTLPPSSTLVSRDSLQPIQGVIRVQTPQVFWGPELKAAFLAAAHEGFVGHDTADVVQRFTNLDVVGVPGDPANIKVTYPQDLEAVRAILEFS